jgi:hypothetical protein
MPFIDTSKGTVFNGAWYNCISLTSFPAINVSAGTIFSTTWQNCTNLRTFEPTDFYSATSLNQAWLNCTSLSSFPQISCPNVTILNNAWWNCTSLSSFPLIDTSQVTQFQRAWNNCNSLTSFPAINTDSSVILQETWYNCNSLTSFPAINTSAVTTIYGTWQNCLSLSSFPQIDCRSVTNVGQAWYNCANLEHFPAGVFDNTSGTTAFNNTFLNTKLNTQSIDNVIVSINNANTSGGTLLLNSTNMQPPSYWGIAASGELANRGWTVTTKTPTAEDQLDATIAPLYFSGDDGAWYDVNDLDTMFEDSFGTIPVTGTSQPVGLILDKSRGLQLGNDLVANGAFDNGTASWPEHNPADGTFTVSGGSAVVTRSSSNIYGIYQDVAVSPNSYVKLTFSVEALTATASFSICDR